uniref:Lipocalin n=1 Tax=Rhipicephalus appendiculatus TaxID=34631 RepID=A0A131YMG4_RHIAP
MKYAAACGFLAVVLLFAAGTGATRAPVDAMRMIGYFRNMTAIYATTATAGDVQLECLHAELTEYDLDAGTGTYLWYVKDADGNDMTITHHMTRGEAPDEVTVTGSSDPDNPFTATVPYTDYRKCFVLKSGDLGGQCMLWVNNAYKDNYPPKCVRKYKKYCDDGVLIYDKQTCADQQGS